MLKGTFTVCHHEPIDSAACRLLSAGAFRVFFDWQRAWLARTRNNRKPLEAIPFSWTSCTWPVKRQTWGRYRSELVEKGFMEAASVKGALYRPSEGWRRYVPPRPEQTRLANHVARTTARAGQTVSFRRVPKTDTPHGQGVPEGDALQGPERGHNPGAPKGTLYNTDNTTNTTPPDPAASGVGETAPAAWPDGGGGGEDGLDRDSPFAERLRRLARYAISDTAAAAMDRATAEMDRQQRRVGRGAAARREAFDPRRTARLRDAWARLDEAGKRAKGPRLIAATLGDTSPRAVRHVGRVMERHGPESVFTGAVSILQDPGNLRSYIAALEARASG